MESSSSTSMKNIKAILAGYEFRLLEILRNGESTTERERQSYFLLEEMTSNLGVALANLMVIQCLVTLAIPSQDERKIAVGDKLKFQGSETFSTVSVSKIYDDVTLKDDTGNCWLIATFMPTSTPGVWLYNKASDYPGESQR